MYEKFFGFTERPFNQTPDPQFFYSSATHEDALGLILQGINRREGFMVLTGEVGTGKTTVCRRLLQALDPTVKAAVIPNPGLTTIELLQSVNQEFGISAVSSSKKELGDELNRFLLENLRAGGGAVLIIDEAQNLSVECLEEIRLLSNLETTKEKLLQIVLIGQPELGDKLRLNELRQLTQRIALHVHLRPLSLEETRRYVSSRLEVVGWKDRVLFTSGAVDRLYALSQGLPRVINFLCDKTLQAACAKETRMIGEAMVEEAGRKRPGMAWPVPHATPGALDVIPERPVEPLPLPASYVSDRHRTRQRVTPVWIGLVCFIVVGVLGALFWLVPTWQKVNDNLTGAGKIPPSTSVMPGVANPDRAEEPAEASSTGSPEAEPSIGLTQRSSAASSPGQEVTGAPQAKSPQESLASGAGDKAPAVDIVPVFALAGAQDIRMAATFLLLQRWGRLQSTPFKALAGRDPSDIIRESGLQTSTIKVDLGLLERLDYPCLVEWRDKPGEGGHPVVLVSVGPQEVTVLDPISGRRVVDRAQFSRQVQGEALVLWKGLPGIKIPLKPKKEKDPVVVELQRVLERQGLFEGSVKGLYDAKTRTAVTKLQSDFGLKKTGLFGNQSYMVLAKLVLGSEVPSLKSPQTTPKKQGT